MCIFGSRSDLPPHASPSTELTAPSSTNELETISGVDMMIRHFRSRSFREYQMRNSPSPSLSRSSSSSSYHTPSPPPPLNGLFLTHHRNSYNRLISVLHPLLHLI